MQEIIDRILEGTFDYENGSLDFSCTKIELTLPKETIYEGSFHITSIPGRITNGYVVTSDLRMECLTPEFSGSDAEIAYRFHGEHMEEGDVIKGSFSIISNHGEYYLPYVVSIEHTTLHSSVGNIKNLFHFANLAKSNWREAINLFYSPDFVRILAGNDAGYLDSYRGLSTYPGNEQNMEEFLIHINKKQKVEYFTEESELKTTLSASSYAVTEGGLTIVKNGWGYTFLKVECEGDFLFTEKQIITDDDFLGNRFRLPVFFDSSHCRKGKNFGCVHLSNPYLSLTIPVEAKLGEGIGASQDLVRKRIIVQLMEFYQAFRLRKISTATWRNETGKLVERLVRLDEDAIDARLFQAQLLITEERFNEAKWILGHALDLMESSEEPEDVRYAYYLYLTTLIPGEESMARDAVSQVEQIYRRHREEWRVAWLLLYLSEEYSANAAGEWVFLEKQFDGGCVSPILYIEALTLLNNNPPLMRKLEEFELQVLYYGARKDALADDTVEQMLYLCGKKREYSQVLLRILQSIYPKRQDVRILQEICALLIKGGKAGRKYLAWYQKGVEAQLRITNLYEYYMMSIDLNVMQPIPKMVLMYFSYQNNLDYERSAYLYHYLIQNQKDFVELYENYGARMEHFVIDQIQKEHINRHLAALYQVMLSPGMISAQTATSLSKLLFANWIQVEDCRVRKVLIYQPGNKEADEYILQDGAAWVAIYGNEYTVVFEDGERNRFVKNVEYTLEKLMLPGRYLRTVAQYVTDSVSLNLYLCEGVRGKGQMDSDAAERCLKVTSSPTVDGAIKSELTLKLLKYYYDVDDMRSLDRFLDTVPLDELTMEERSTVVNYMVLRGKSEEAYEQIREYYPYFVEPKTIVRLLDDLMRERDMVEDPVMLAAAFYAFHSGKYGSGILIYLTRYFRGMTKVLRDVWKAARSFDVDCLKLCERMLVQMLYSGAFVGEKMEIFRYYVSQVADDRVEEAFLAQCSYDYFVRERVTDSYIFGKIQERYDHGEELQRVCKFAFLKYYAETPQELGERQFSAVTAFLREMMGERIHLNFFRDYLERKDMPYRKGGAAAFQVQEITDILQEMEDKTIIEYRTHPGGKARIHYVIVHENGESGEYRSEYMRDVYGGVCFKEFVLFFGEDLQYYIMEETNGGEQLTESGNLQRSDVTSEKVDSRFDLINDIVISKTLQDYDTLDGLLQEYFRKEYMNDELFRLQ